MVSTLAHGHCRRPGREEGWKSSIIGVSKRDLAKDVLSVFGESYVFYRLLTGLMRLL